MTTQTSGMEILGIGPSDFSENELKDFGRSMTLQVKVGTIDSMGNVEESFVDTTLNAVFHERSRTVFRTEEGLVTLAPAYLMSRVTDSVGTGDKLVVEGKTWRVFNVIVRDGVHRYSDLYLWDE